MCAKCGRLMSVATGGNVFTVCDECWDVADLPSRRHSDAAWERKCAQLQAERDERLRERSPDASRGP